MKEIRENMFEKACQKISEILGIGMSFNSACPLGSGEGLLFTSHHFLRDGGYQHEGI